MAETGPVQVSRTYVQSRFGQLHLRIAHPETATRPPLICFHMSPMSGRIYERFLGAIGTDRIAVAADTPGFGMSDAPPAPPEIADYAAAMWDALDALGTTGPVDAMGYHTGSKIAVELALSRPERVRRVILVAAPIMTEAERQEMREHYGPKLPLPDGSHLAALWRSFLHYNLSPSLPIEQVADAFPDMLSGRNLAWWGHRAAFNHYLERRLPLVQQPVLVFNPGDDLWDFTLRAQPFLTNGQIVDLPGWGHGFLDGFTGDAAALTRGFLDAPEDAPFGSISVPADAKARAQCGFGQFGGIPGCVQSVGIL
jgi:pimeloyl-ACP methyl ester carboxylesterase